jgi:hypothetical protein
MSSIASKNSFATLDDDTAMSPIGSGYATPLSDEIDRQSDLIEIKAVQPKGDVTQTSDFDHFLAFEAMCVEMRLEAGVYTSMADQFLTSRRGEALAEASYKTDFNFALEKNGRNHFFTDTATYQEYKTLIFGELTGETNISAKGNHWFDRTKVG